MQHTFHRGSGRKAALVALLVALLAPLLGLPPSGPAAVEADTARSDGPCRVVDFDINGVPKGARSICPPGTWRHWHQVHIRCLFIVEPEEHGPVVGGTSVSEATCGRGHHRIRSWNTQGPDE
ncbi:hypothetical protein [Nonomuraea sp. NPDC050783]|uniref:hypothetical protein n=1 Tax=Nonomuraea sp. NPDC050783 TaxID=3154634 RepID=UPI00346592C2